MYAQASSHSSERTWAKCGLLIQASIGATGSAMQYGIPARSKSERSHCLECPELNGVSQPEIFRPETNSAVQPIVLKPQARKSRATPSVIHAAREPYRPRRTSM